MQKIASSVMVCSHPQRTPWQPHLLFTLLAVEATPQGTGETFQLDPISIEPIRLPMSSMPNCVWKLQELIGTGTGTGTDLKRAISHQRSSAILAAIRHSSAFGGTHFMPVEPVKSTALRISARRAPTFRCAEDHRSVCRGSCPISTSSHHESS